jgi:acetyl esterase
MGHLRSLAALGVGTLLGIACERKEEAPRVGAEPVTANGASDDRKSEEFSTRDAGTGRDTLSDADPDMKKVLDAFASLGVKPVETLPPEEARRQPTLADAVRAVLQKDGKAAAPEPLAKVEDRTLPPELHSLPVRIYTPRARQSSYPVVVYYHGGGFVMGSLDAYDAAARGLANGAKAIVVSVDYRLAPEHKFPTAHEDAHAAYIWVTKQAASFGGDPKNVAVAGESAGGNLAANVAIMARDKAEQPPVHLLLVYPVASSNTSSVSYQKYADAKPLNKAMMTWFFEQYFESASDARDPRIDLVSANLEGLPKTTIISAEIDPLRSDAKLLAEKLETAGVAVEEKSYDDVTHEFFGMGAVLDEAREAVKYASSRLEGAFSKPEKGEAVVKGGT